MRMRKPSIAQMRWDEVKRLASIHAEDYTEEDLREAERLMNSYYRLCGLAERNLYLANDERTCNRKSTEQSEERELRWYKRLSDEFKAFSGLELVSFSYLPSICEVVDGAPYRRISAFFYD